MVELLPIISTTRRCINRHRTTPMPGLRISPAQTEAVSVQGNFSLAMLTGMTQNLPSNQVFLSPAEALADIAKLFSVQ